MAKFQQIAKALAPLPPRPAGALSARKRVYEQYIQSLAATDVGKLTPEKNETARGLRLRLSRAGRRTERPVRTWAVKDTVYFEVAS